MLFPNQMENKQQTGIFPLLDYTLRAKIQPSLPSLPNENKFYEPCATVRSMVDEGYKHNKYRSLALAWKSLDNFDSPKRSEKITRLPRYTYLLKVSRWVSL